MAADDGAVDVGGVQALELADEGVGTHHVQGGHAEDLGGVEDSGRLEDLAGDGDRGVDGVGDDADHQYSPIARPVASVRKRGGEILNVWN